jgi:hypothetical protein
MTTNWWDSSTTFKKCTLEKVSFILLGVFDLALTILAMRLGLWELNPIIRFLVRIPVLLVVVKFVLPVLIAWVMPGRLLWPSIGAMAAVIFWNIKELVVFLR